MSTGRVSCIVPVWNGARYLTEALDSIRAQSHRATEIIVVDDGSTDDTPSVLASYGNGLRTIRQPNAGAAAARNAGLALASGEYLAFLDADDLWHPDKLRRQLDRFAARPELAVSFSFIENFWSEEALVEPAPDPALLRPVPGYVCPTMVARRSAFDRLGPFDASRRHASEPEWILKAAESGLALEMIPEVLVRRRLHPKSASARNASRSHEEYLHLLKTSLDRRRAGVALYHDFRAHAPRKDGPGSVR